MNYLTATKSFGQLVSAGSPEDVEKSVSSQGKTHRDSEKKQQNE